MKKVFLILLTLVLVNILSVNQAKADGMILPPPDYYIYETDQKAVIVHEKGMETMVLSVNFQGNAKDFAWIVPTPKKPIVEESTDNLFTQLRDLTESYGYEAPYIGRGLGIMEDSSDLAPTVAVVETKTVGIFEIKVLASNSSQALAKWLSDNKYQYPEEYSRVLDSYIENNWYFTAIKVDAALTKSNLTKTQLNQGHATPLKFIFSSEKIVFPLKISSIISEETKSHFPQTQPLNTTESQLKAEEPEEGVTATPDEPVQSLIYPPFNRSVNIHLYVFSDHKVAAAGFHPYYARWLKKAEIENLATNSQGDPWIDINSRKLFLTTLSRTMQYSQMDQDIYLTRAQNNQTVGVPTTIWWLAIILFFGMFLLIWLSPFGFTFIISAVVYHFTDKKVWQGIAVVLEILSILFALTGSAILIAYLGLYYSDDQGYYDNYTNAYTWSLALGAILALVLMIIWRIIESRNNKRNIS